MHTVTHCTVPLDHPAFAGHFPDVPILPGVVLLDLALQAITDARALVLHHCTINSIKFLSPVHPGEVLSISHSQMDNGTVRFDISTANRKIAGGSLVINSK
jgi:3-hydroxymyristoyl/3-hydroxydecanoyl-(acyl carrier protein) dehydratase